MQLRSPRSRPARSGSRPRPARSRPRLPVPDVVTPGVPGAARELAGVAVLDLVARRGHLGPPGQTPLAERPALVRAAVAQGEQLAADVEHADLPTGHLDDLAGARRQL